MKAIWKGAINFGLVNIPVKLYSATQQSTLDLDMVDSKDGEKIQFQRINSTTGKVVEWEDIAKAYWINDDYVLLDEDDFEAAAPEKTKVIGVNHFIDEKEIDSIYFENSYYAEPEKSGEKAYALLREALVKTGKVGIAQFVLRTAETLIVLKPLKNVLVISKIRFAQEIRSTEDLNLPSKSIIKPDELKMAVSLINQYTEPFQIEKYKDEYSDALLKVIKAKASGKRAKIRKLKITDTKQDTLMDQLKASLLKKKIS